LAESESRAILDFLFKHAQQPHLIYRHKWAPGDLVVWDNRSTWHLAIADYDMNERRHFLRTSIAGDLPY
jgi:taurine dioxygenase